jgi:hypothetical protein
MATNYIVVFDRDPSKSYIAFHNELTDDPDIDNWWHYIKSCYLIVTDLSAGELSDKVAAAFKKSDLSTTHLVLKVELKERQGMLTEDAWQWIRDHAK